MKEFFDMENKIDLMAEQMRLSLSNGERASFAEELKKMADYTYPRLASEEKALPFSYVQATPSAREDIAISSTPEERELILSCSPSLSGDHVAVPKIIKEED